MVSTVQCRSIARALVTLAVCLPAAPGAELQLYFSALQRILAEQVFTQDGRMYVKNDARNKCNFAYLEKPAISADRGRLFVRARFSGRAAQNFFGRCIGLGDSFDVLIGALPVYRDGSLALNDVRVDSPGRDGFYIRKVRTAMAESLARSFKYNVGADAKRMLEDNRGDAKLRQELRRFDVREIHALQDSLVVVIDFQLAVK
jgi:hypothetical protein